MLSELFKRVIRSGVNLRRNLEMSFEKIDLEAVNTECNISRYYTLQLDRNLFDDHCVTTVYGRRGHSGTTRSYHFASVTDARAKFNALYKKRLNSEKRIGVNYKVIHKICA